MARKVTGVSSVLKASRVICRMVGRFGVAQLAASTTNELAQAALALSVACRAFEALDDYPVATDRTAGGSGVGDEDIPNGQGSLAKEALQ